VLTERPLIRRYAPPSPTRGEGVPTAISRLFGLLPLWEKVAEGRMRGPAVSTTAGLTWLVLAATGTAQEAGWAYSPYTGEGDRAAMGCSYGSTPDEHACVVVRCEDDFTVALYLDTTRAGGDAGRWSMQIDRQVHEVTAVDVAGSPYGAKVEGDVAAIINDIKNGDSFFIDPRDGAEPPNRGIGLSGSLYTINQALYFCAPRILE
jgi:hypothetical protein